MKLKTLFLASSLFFIQQINAQRNFDHYNRLGINAGFTLFDIFTEDLNTKQAGGFMVGLTTRGAFRNDFDLIYGLNFYNNQVEIQGNNPENIFESTKNIKYTIGAAQLTFLGSYNIIKHHLSLEFGPILNVNGKLKLNDKELFENYILEGYNTLTAKDIQSISPVNFHVAGGLTFGIESFRASVQYQYGVTNMLHKLNDKNLENTDFKGNSSTITFMGVLYF